MRRRAVIVLCFLLILAACRSDNKTPTTTTTLPATTEVPTTTTLDVALLPTPAQLQDPVYWNAVLARINRVLGDIFRTVVATGKVEPSTVEALHQSYGPIVFPDQYKALREIAAGDRHSVIIPPGDPAATVVSIVKADVKCVALIASLDYTRVSSTVPTALNAFRLLPREGIVEDRAKLTPWIIDEFYIITPELNAGSLCVG